jgi:hypothetical protein
LEPPSRKSTHPQPAVNTKRRTSPQGRKLHLGRMRIKAWRRHSATSLLSWL